MTCQVRQVPFSDSLLPVVARDLLEACPGADRGGLSEALILLPSSRACRTLEHLLLEESGDQALLLPRILTDRQWAQEAVFFTGSALDDLPDDRIRPLALAPGLAALPWLQERPESAPGLAAEFIRLFDQVRLERRDRQLLAGGSAAEFLDPGGWGAPGEAETAAQQGQRIGEVWRLYRRVIPRDRIDELCGLAEALSGPEGAGKLPGCGLAVVAGYGRLTRLQALLIQAVLDRADQGRIYLPCVRGRLDEAFCATWSALAGSRQSGPDPLGPARGVSRRLAEAGNTAAAEFSASEPVGSAKDPTLRERLAGIGPVEGVLAPQGRLELVPCPDPETESLLVAGRVVEILTRGDDTARVAVAVPDPRLAARIVAQLRDAGIDVDQTLGQPLAALPAGLLARFILRAVLTDLRAEPLLEVLTHPSVSLPVGSGSHGLWTLRLEGFFRRVEGPQPGLAGLGRKAAQRDQVIDDLFGRSDPQMTAFVAAIGEAFAPLLDLRGQGPRPWAVHLGALRAVWGALTRQGAAGVEAGPRQDDAALTRLWDLLEQDSGRLAAVSLGDFAADFGRLLAEENVPPHRARQLPVVVTGLVEVRLEHFDHLILAGMRDGAFPSRPALQHLLIPGAMTRLGLPDWREHLGLEAELFLRLLHNGDQVTVTWSAEEDGQPQLPSPFVSRLLLALGRQPEDLVSSGGDLPRWRREPLPWLEIRGRQAAFAAEPRPVPALAEVRPQTLLSWSALRQWRDCPYRFLLERRFALSPEEDLRREFRRQDYGSLVHAALADFLAPQGEGIRAVEAQDPCAALACLDQAALALFGPGAEDLPVRRLWLDSFRRAMPTIVEAEIARAASWRPWLLEAGFTLDLQDLIRWLEMAAPPEGFDLSGPDGFAGQDRNEVRRRAEGIRLRGTLDRVDAHRTIEGAAAVLDYKTGQLPAVSRVQDLEELQIVLYAAVVEAGAVAPDGGLRAVREASYYQISESRSGPPKTPHLDGTGPAGRRLLLAGVARLIRLALEAADPAAVHPLLPREQAGQGQAQLPCRFCDLRGVCRLEEQDRRDLPAGLWRKVDRLVNDRKGGY